MAEKSINTWKTNLHKIVYEADTPAGKLFDVVLIFLILISIVLVMLESVDSIDAKYHTYLITAEWAITILFTVEYILRIVTVNKPFKYILSFYGLVDLVSTIPLYLSYFFAGTNALLALRAFRLLRIFRILKLVHFLGEASQLKSALKASKTKITVFIYTVLVLCIILGTIMYLVEGKEAGFTSIPVSIYWTIVTLTTVGYGDITPITPLGQAVASFIMILGYGIIAVPTGIVTSEMAKQGSQKTPLNSQLCQHCHAGNHSDNAKFCHNCGTPLH